MCLLVFAFHRHRDYPLIFAGNRDEFHGRPAKAAHFWDEKRDLLAGRDLQAGGTWLGVTRSGRFATVTNFREPDMRRSGMRSRGELVVEYLSSSVSPPEFLESLSAKSDSYEGFNFLLGDRDVFYYFSNRNSAWQELRPGIYGLSNGRLDTPWPKVRRSRHLFKEIIERDVFAEGDLLDLLGDRYQPDDAELPETGVGEDLERLLSAIFISGDAYGTRASTVLTIHRSGEIAFAERSFGPNGLEIGTRDFRFQTAAP